MRKFHLLSTLQLLQFLPLILSLHHSHITVDVHTYADCMAKAGSPFQDSYERFCFWFVDKEQYAKGDELDEACGTEGFGLIPSNALLPNLPAYRARITAAPRTAGSGHGWTAMRAKRPRDGEFVYVIPKLGLELEVDIEDIPPPSVFNNQNGLEEYTSKNIDPLLSFVPTGYWHAQNMAGHRQAWCMYMSEELKLLAKNRDAKLFAKGKRVSSATGQAAAAPNSLKCAIACQKALLCRSFAWDEDGDECRLFELPADNPKMIYIDGNESQQIWTYSY